MSRGRNGGARGAPHHSRVKTYAYITVTVRSRSSIPDLIEDRQYVVSSQTGELLPLTSQPLPTAVGCQGRRLRRATGRAKLDP